MAEAESKWSAALAINPHSVYVYAAEADALPLDPDDDRAAIAKLRTALTMNPRDAGLHRKLANRYADLGEPQAEAEFQQAMQMNPGNVVALADWGGFLAAHGRPAEAESKWRTALTINPKSAYVYVVWGDAFVRVRKYQCAVLKYREALKC